MKVFPTEQIRNVCLVSHATVGKTSLAEALLFSSGMINRMGTIEDGSTASDYHPDEIDRKFSISTSLLHCIHKDKKINLIDTPGYPDFVGEVRGAMRVADIAVILVSAVTGVEVGTETVAKVGGEHGVSRVVFVNMCDREHADFDKTAAMIGETFRSGTVPIQLPLATGEGFNSIIDLLQMKLVTFDATGKPSLSDIPAEAADRAASAREALVEAVAEGDDALLEKFFDAGELTEEELRGGLRKGIVSGAVTPVLCGAATRAVGASLLLDFLSDYTPHPGERGPIKAKKTDESDISLEPASSSPFSALVFKTISEQHLGELSFFRIFSGSVTAGTEVFNASRSSSEKLGQLYVMNGKSRDDAPEMHAGDIGAAVKLKDTHTGNTLCSKTNPVILDGIKFPDPVIRVALEPKSKGDEDKISQGLASLHEEDPSFVVTVDPELHQTLIAGQGELHLDIVVRRISEKYGLEIEQKEPRIPYRETIRGKAEGQHKYKKQSGGRGQYGDVYLRIESQPRGTGFEFIDEIVGGAVPSKYIPAVEKGVRESMDKGPLAGCPVVDVRVALYDGSYHSVDSSDMAFKIAASMGFKKLFKEATPVLMEPIFEVEIQVPEEYMGDVMGDISSRRGKILGMEAEGVFQIIRAHVPLAELYKYSTTLRSLTQGKGVHRRKFDHYADVPKDLQKKIIEDYEASREG